MADDQSDYIDDPPEIEWLAETDRDDDLGPASEDPDLGPADDLEPVGMASTGMPVFHSAESGTLYHGEVNANGRVTPRFDDEESTTD